MTTTIRAVLDLMGLLMIALVIAGTPSRAQAGGEGLGDIAGIEGVRGTVTKVAKGDVFVKTPAGAAYRIETGPNTRFVKDAQPMDDRAVHPGDIVIAGGELDEKAHTLGAIFVAVVDPQQLADFDRRRSEFGKTWLAGEITDIRGTHLTVKRPDDVMTIVSVDENTSFRKQHESVTLRDLKVGDGMTARGALHDGAFAGTLVTVVDAEEIRAWAKLRRQ
jgi:hypothetical protein